MRPATFLIKPASSLCGLRCGYCFYHDVAQNRETGCYGMMSEETAEALVREAFAYASGYVNFAFQGGEPLTAGLPFYERFLKLEQRYNTRNIPVTHSIQTNGIALDRNWAEFFARNHFLVGLSLDGPPKIHDRFRTGPKGEPTFQKVMNAAELLKRAQVDWNALCVVTGPAAAHGGQIYKFLKRNGCRYLQFIPCLNPLGEENTAYSFTLTGEDYGVFLKTLFDCWYPDLFTASPVSIRQFDNYAGMLAGRPPESCGMSGTCACYFLVEADGGVYPCDFYVLDRWRLGSVGSGTLEEMMNGSVSADFIEESRTVPADCEGCRWYPLCRNGCKRERDPETGKNWLCTAYRTFFDYAYPRLEEIARRL